MFVTKANLCTVLNPLAVISRDSRGLPRDVWVLSIIAFCVSVGFGVMVPVLPVFARSFEVSNLMVGMVISAFAAMRLLTSPACTPLISRLGERSVLGVGMFIVAASSAAAGLATSFWALLGMRALGGIGSAMFTVAAMTLLLRTVEPQLRGRASALYSGGFLIGGMAGPAVGGLFAAISLTAPFFVYAATLSVAGIVGLCLLSRPQGQVEKSEKPEMALSEAVRDVRYRAACLSNFAQGWQSFGVRSSLVPVLVTEVLHKSTSWTGIAFAIAAVAQTIALGPVGRAVDTIGRRPLMILAGLATGLAALAMPWSPTIWVLTAVLCVYGIGSAAHSTAPTAVLGDVTGGRGGAPVATFSMMSDLGAIIGPLAAGALADAFGMGIAFATGGLLLLAGAALSWTMPRYSAPRPNTLETA
ncbi:putative MFS family arabinose efflux permease [Luteococcus japonicus]|uniref:MFS superfamily, multidrug transport protein n=2 Tax=Luteococcus japonicus TaxID=33984 RepID=A0A1R4KHK4_9ACTN|nr:putative MFS family arabinose efflux permease [Luteococcus japonicus]SJN43574.1 MFS superfamily, multidrug transport protein [Luteococcus japonicus LSP_Lj1]